MNKRVSIIIPAYNAENYLKRSLESALNQTYPNVEVIVVDDGSTDRTAEAVMAFNDSRIVYAYQTNQGQGAARNHGIRISKGNYITFLDADDAYLASKVEEEVRFFEAHPEYDAVYCNALHFFSGKPHKLYKLKGKFPTGNIFMHLLHTSLINPNTLMISRKVVENGVMFGEDKEGRYFDDWSFFLKVSRAGYKFGYLDRSLVRVEMREDSNTQWEIQWIMKKTCLEFFERLFSRMSVNERKMLEVERILRDKRFKLSMAYLIAGQKKESLNIIKNIIPKIWFYPVRITIDCLPSYVLKALLTWVWKIRRKLSFSRVADNSCHLT